MDKDASRILSGLIGGLIMDDLFVRMAYRNLRKKHNRLVDDHNDLRETVRYLCHMINENDVVLDEFDWIALQGQIERKPK